MFFSRRHVDNLNFYCYSDVSVVKEKQIVHVKQFSNIFFDLFYTSVNGQYIDYWFSQLISESNTPTILCLHMTLQILQCVRIYIFKWLNVLNVCVSVKAPIVFTSIRCMHIEGFCRLERSINSIKYWFRYRDYQDLCT